MKGKFRQWNSKTTTFALDSETSKW